MSDSISELIYDHFAGLEPKDKTQPLLKRVPTGRYAALSLTSLKNKALSTLCANAYKGKKRDFCQDALSVLSDTTLKTTIASDGKFDVQFEFRKLDKIKKDFWQLATAGIFPGDVQEKLKMIEDVKAKKNAGYKSFGAFVGNDDYWKIKSSCNQTDAKLLQLMNENGEVVIDWANKQLHFTSSSLLKNKKFDIKDVTAAIFASNLQTLEDKAAAMYNDGDLIEPAVQLASILFIQAVTEQADLKDGNDVPSEFAEKMLPFLYDSMPNLSDEDNETVRQMAFELANERIQELNNMIEAHNKLSSKPLEKYPDIKQFYHDTQVYRLLDQKINKFQDLPIKWAKEGSNYLWRIIDENGVVSEVYVEDKDLIKDGDFQEAFKRLESNDEDKILSAFEFFDREIAKTTKSKAINNFEEAASAIFSNLILLSYASEKAKISDENRKTMEQIFTVPLLQCLDELDNHAYARVERKAYDDAKALFEKADKAQDFEDNFKFFEHRYNRFDIAKKFLNTVGRILRSKSKREVNKKRPRYRLINDLDEICNIELEAKKNRPEGCTSIPMGIYHDIAPDKFKTENAQRKEDYKAVYEVSNNPGSVMAANIKGNVKLEILACAGQALKEIEKIGIDPDKVITQRELDDAITQAKLTRDDIKATLQAMTR